MNQDNDITLIRQFNRQYTQYLGVFDKEIFNTDLTWSEARILLEMQLNDLETVTSIAHFLKVDKAYISRIIKKFKKQDLIELVQDKTDGRKQLITFTPAGLMLLETIDTASNAQINNLFTNMSQSDMAIILQAMQLMTTALDTKEEDNHVAN
ncbi:winged helix-turn-helix transcriptional regulator [Weissella minor]|uniref:MarR family winged helix-turn-helix transcriptional regulator n=1 Tax=Weissella minor TaxID=1620 RepID=UPI001BB071CD|nr:MarR family winged helix-turn-helix transcriptional regulator [Weissella minor]MBS0949094.1 winged helix-turn-helix transcriptional regulator [Weissella minor]